MNNNNRNLAIALGIATVTATVLFFAFRKGRKGISSVASEKLSSILNRELSAWAQGKTKEGDQRTMARLRDYWASVGVTDWDERKMADTAWSAAFISYAMANAGFSDFPRSASHSTYIARAIANAKGGQRGITALRPSDARIEVGDIVCYGRNGQGGWDAKPPYPAHCDICMDVQGSEAITIGGNVSDSVSVTKVPLENGKISSKARNPYFAVLRMG